MVRSRGLEGVAFLAPALDGLLCRTSVVNIIIFIILVVSVVVIVNSVIIASPDPRSISANGVSADDIFPVPGDTSRIDAAGAVVADPETRDQDVEDPRRASVELGFERAEQQLRRIREEGDQARHAEHVEVDCSPGYGHGPR